MEVYKRLQGNKQPFPGSKVQTGPHAGHLPPAQAGVLGGKNRPERRLFSPSGPQKFKTLSPTSGGGAGLGVPSWPFWPERHAPAFSNGYAHLRKKVASKRSPGIHIPGRHSRGGVHPHPVAKRFGAGGTRSPRLRFQNKSEKVHFHPQPGGHPFGVSNKFCRGQTPAFAPQNERGQKGTGKVHHEKYHVKKTAGCNSGPDKGQLTGSSLFEGFHHNAGAVSSAEKLGDLGSKVCHLPRNKIGAETGERNNGRVVGKTFCLQAQQDPTLRFQRPRLGRDRPPNRAVCTRVLARKKSAAHQHKGNGSGHKHGTKFGQAKRKCPPLRRQPSNLLLLAKGGGRKNPFNQMLQPFFRYLMKNGITLQLRWVPSERCLADPLSRWSQDRGDYSLNPVLFQKIKTFFQKHIQLQVDLFASPGNKKLDRFVARWPHWQAAGVDALKIPLDQLGGGLYANPPWNVIEHFLVHLQKFPQVQVLMVVPYWASAIWWPQLTKLRVPKTPCLQINPHQGMFSNCWGEKMPPTRWPLICLICSGKFWKGKKFKLGPLTIF